MDKMQSDIAAIQAALSRGESKTESGLTPSEESRIIERHNRAGRVLSILAAITGTLAALTLGKGFFFFGLFVCWLFLQARIK